MLAFGEIMYLYDNGVNNTLNPIHTRIKALKRTGGGQTDLLVQIIEGDQEVMTYFFIVSYYVKRVETFWKYSMNSDFMPKKLTDPDIFN